MSTPSYEHAALVGSLPPVWPGDPTPAIAEHVRAAGRKIVVLDDDPTGTQTVAQVPVLTTWDVAALAAELRDPGPLCYVLTNSRSMPLAEAQALNTAIGQSLRAAARQVGRPFDVISRSDSTLRGHYPGETDALAAAIGGCDATLLIPAFFDGGRYTIDDMHYVAQGEQLVPAGETPFARDASFGYRASNMRAWVEEKSGGRIKAADVRALSLALIRQGGPDTVAAALVSLPRGSVCIANAADPRDLEVVALGLLNAEARGMRVLLRTAASFVPVRAGLPRQPLLRPADLALEAGTGGVIVVGSYVPATSAQLDVALQRAAAVPIAVDVAALLDERRDRTLADAAHQAEQAISTGRNALVFTSRALITGRDAADSLAIGRAVSAGLVALMQQIGTKPRFVIAKGGITSSDLATKGLGVRRALVLGQIVPGVPVWQLGPESRLPGVPYVVFPGNVGAADSLAHVIALLSAP